MGEVEPGSDLAETIVAAAPWLRDGDVLVVTSKIVSKSEGRLVDVPTAGQQRDAARDEIITAETARRVATRGQTRIVQTHHGFVMASAGVDASNVERSRLVLLPKDPDASARALRLALRERYGLEVAVIISDTMGRPWRNGLTDVALGAAGLTPMRDHRGEIDPYGNELHLTQMAVVDELSSAAELVKGKCDGVPVAVVRGYLPAGLTGAADGPGAAALIRDAEHDLFRLGTEEARADGLRSAAALVDAETFGDAPVAVAEVGRIVGSIAAGVGTVFTVMEPSRFDLPPVPPGTTHVIACGITGDAGPARYVRLGADMHRLRCALVAAGLASRWLSTASPGMVGALAVGPQ
jgi:coenzyme F420-0:L-glutamate ligase/coenzyme F420-1:gamma-L-glutamate ligase